VQAKPLGNDFTEPVGVDGVGDDREVLELGDGVEPPGFCLETK